MRSTVSIQRWRTSDMRNPSNLLPTLPETESGFPSTNPNRILQNLCPFPPSTTDKARSSETSPVSTCLPLLRYSTTPTLLYHYYISQFFIHLSILSSPSLLHRSTLVLSSSNLHSLHTPHSTQWLPRLVPPSLMLSSTRRQPRPPRS